MYPNCVANFFFDQSSAHGAFASDALNATQMNIKPGGKQCCMHSTRISMDNPNPELQGKVQEMVFLKDFPPAHPYYRFSGQPKDMQVVLEEQELWTGLVAEHGNNASQVPGICTFCKLSQKAKDALTCASVAQMLFGNTDGSDAEVNNILHPSTSFFTACRKSCRCRQIFRRRNCTCRP